MTGAGDEAFQRARRGARAARWGLATAALGVSLGLALGGCASPAAPPSPGPAAPSAEGPITAAAIERLHAEPCPPEQASAFGGVDPSGILCGTLTVPLDHADPDGATLELEVAIREGDRPSGLLLLLGGGPGGTSRWTTAVLPLLMPQVADEYQFVALDHRGTGADALDCPSLQAEIGQSDLLPPSPATLEECAALLGERAAHQATADTVADLELLREALGAEGWVLDGMSYGTFVEARYAMAHPDAIRGLVLDSPVDPRGVDPFARSSMAEVPRVLGELCAAQHCGFDPVAALERVLASGYPALDLLDLLVTTSVTDAGYTGILDALEAAAAGDTAALDERVAGAQAAARGEALAAFSAGAHVATLCADTPMPWGGADTDPAERRAALDAAVAAIDPAETHPFPPSLGAELGPIAACLNWPATRYAPPLTGDFPDLPALILAGGVDLSTPIADLDAVLEVIPGAVEVVIPDAGHAAQMRPDGAAAVSEFLLTLGDR